jgi:hypothetical protein
MKKEKLEEKAELCTRKVLKKFKGFVVHNNFGIYRCNECSGEPGACPSYINHYSLAKYKESKSEAEE